MRDGLHKHKNKFHAFLTIFSILYIAFVFCPTYVARADLMDISGDILLLAILLIVSVSIVLCLAIFLSRVRYDYVEPILTATLLLVFIFATIVPRRVGMLDGQDLTEKTSSYWYLVNLLSWSVLLAISWKFKNRLRGVAGPILLLCVAYSLYARLTKVDDASILSPEQTLLWKDDFGILSSDRNVLVVAIDMLQGSIVERTFQQHPEALREFDGFTIFTRGFTSFPFTNYAKPSILSGKTYANKSGTMLDNLRAAENDSFATDLLKSGYAVRSIDFLRYIGGKERNSSALTVGSSGFLGRDIKLSHSAYMYGYALSAGIARIVGVWPKNPFFGEADDYVLSTKLGSAAVSQELPTLIRREGGISPRALLFWNFTAHAPVALARDGTVLPKKRDDERAIMQETLFAFDQLQSLFASMKRANVYDNTLILVVSDHGHPLLARKDHLQHVSGLETSYKTGGNYVPVSQYNATLWVKPPFLNDAATVSLNPIWNGDVRAVIESYRDGLHVHNVEALLKNIRSNNPEVEVLYFTKTETNPQYNSEFHEFVKARSLSSIHKGFIAKSAKNGVERNIYTAGDNALSLLTGEIGRGEPPGTWLLESPAVLALRIKDYEASKAYSLAITGSPLVRAGVHDKQRVIIKAAGERVAECAFTLEKHSCSLELPKHFIGGSGELTLEFVPLDATTHGKLGFGTDQSVVSIYVQSIVLR